jgi:hypothetical protein
MIEIEAPDGSIVEFPDGTPDDVMAKAMQQAFAAKPPSVGAPEAMTRGAAQGVTFGFADEMAGVGAASPIPGSAAGKTTLGAFGAPDVIAGGIRMLANRLGFGSGGSEAYTNERNRVRGENQTASAERPYSYMGGQLVGALASAAPLAGAVGQGASLAGNVMRGGVTGAAMGAAQGAGEALELEDVPVEAAKGGGIGLAVGGAAPALIAGARRVVSPLRTAPERQTLVEALRREGVDLTAGQRTGNKPLMWAESTFGDMPGAGGRSAAIQNRQGQQFTQAAMRRAGSNAPLATADAIDDTFTRLGSQFDDLASRNTMRMDEKFAGDMGDAVRDYIGLVSPSQRAPVVGKVVDDVMGFARTGGAIDGPAYQNLRSRLETAARNSSDGDLSRTLRAMRNALDDAMERSIPATSPDKGAWGEVRRQYRNLIPIEKAATGAGERAAEGYLSPAQLRNAVRNQGLRSYARGNGDLAELARAGTLLNQMPNSGTAPRQNIQNLVSGVAPNLAGAAVGSASTGDWRGAAAGFAAPAVAGRLLMSRPVQAYLGNQAASRALDPQVQRLIEVLLANPARQQMISRD